MGGGWTYRLQYVRCGKPGCRCAGLGEGGEGHGPYWYGFRRRGPGGREGGVESRYFGKRRPPGAPTPGGARRRRERWAALKPRRAPAGVEAAVLATTRKHPTWGKQRVANEVGLVTPTGVLAVWLRNGVPTTAPARGAWAADQDRRGVPQRRRRVEVECPACHRRFVAEGGPPFSCPRCGVGGVRP